MEETAIEKHLRLQKQADELAEKIDFNAYAHVLRTRDLAVTQAERLFESRGWWKPALQGRFKNEKDDDEYSESTVDSTLHCESTAVKEETERFVGKDTVDTPKTKKSELFATLLSENVLHQRDQKGKVPQQHDLQQCVRELCKLTSDWPSGDLSNRPRTRELRSRGKNVTPRLSSSWVGAARLLLFTGARSTRGSLEGEHCRTRSLASYASLLRRQRRALVPNEYAVL